MTLLRCPRTGNALTRAGDRLVAEVNGAGPPDEYPIIDGIPVLIDFRNSVLVEEEVLARAGNSAIERPRYDGATAWVKRLVSPEKASTRRNVQALLSHLDRRGPSPRVLVVGGGSIGQGMGPLYEHPSLELVSFDIYRSDLTHFIADAHQIPLASDSFDAVVVQAVLEHVLQPQTVVEEIWRVLKPSGLVYAETPFMQQVHEAAYDFTRFTESGHRYLFRDFDLISSGSSGGPGLQFMWSLDYLARGVFRSTKAGKAAKLMFFWTQYFDRIIPPQFAVDGASGVYFLGAKAAHRMQPSEIIRHYKGAQ